MAGFGNLQQWNRQAADPAQPRGMRQAGRAAYGYEQSRSRGGDGAGYGNLGQFTSERGYVGQAQSWYTGANQGGTENGWNTGFWQRAMDQQERLAEQGRLGQQFETKHATGVVTWDHTSEDGNTRYHFGDVYDNGKKQGNVFHQFDRDTANLMMSDLVFDADTKAHIYRESDPRKALDKAMRNERRDRNVRIPQENAARDFQADVVKRADQIEGGKGEAAIITGATLGGAGIGASIGSLVPGVGTLIGGGIGGAVGGLSAWLNQDSLNEQAARAAEITKLSTDQTNTVAAGGTFVNQWSGFAGKLIVPFGNTVQGFADASQGKLGDGKSEFYRTDKHGDRTTAKVFRVADVVGAVADAALQFSNPIGMAMYTTTMGGTIAGETFELAASGGKSFDYSRGGFDNIFTDEQGKFDLSAAGAGIGKIGIDVLQLGMAKGLAGKVDATRLASGQEKAFSGRILGGRLPQYQQRIAAFREKTAEKVGLGYSAEQKAAVAAGGKVEEAAGRRFVLSKEGKVVGDSRATMALLAPSEAISALSTRVLAMRGAAKAKGAYTADDFYRAATQMATGERKIQTAIVNGFGEGTEEVIQAVLEPHSHGQAISSSEVINAGLYGFAMGGGMGLGMNTRMPTADQRMSEQARAAYMRRTGDTISRRDWTKQWESSSATQKATLSMMGSMDSATMKAALKKIQDNQAKDMVSGVVGAQRLADAIQTVLKSSLANASDRTDGAFVVVQTEDAGEIDEDGNIQPWSQPTDAVVGSARQTAINLSHHLKGIGHQITTMRNDVEFWDKKVAKEPTNPEFLRSQAENVANIAAAERVLELGAVLEKQMHDSAVYIDDEQRTEPEIRAEVMLMNKRLADAFHQRDTSLPESDRLALSRAAFALVARDPHDHAGSYQFLLPQVSQKLTMNGAHNLLQISHAVLSPLGADYDGDKVRLLNQLILNDEVYLRARSGSHFLGAGSSVNIKAPAYEKWILEDMTSAVNSTNDAMRNFASGKLTEIGTIIRRRYTEDKAGNPILDDEGNVVIGEETMDAILETFYENVHHGNPEARQKLLDDIAKHAGGRITAYAQAHLSNEWLWIDQVVRSTMQRFQEGYAAHNPRPGPMTDSELSTLDNVYRTPVNNMSTSIKERIATKAATVGATLNQMFPGDSLFRKFQKLHYSSYLAPVLSAEGLSDEQMSVMEQVVMYEALGQGITQSELDAVAAKDDITARVMVKLERLALNAQKMHPSLAPHEAKLLVANMQVLDLEVDNTGKAIPKYGRGRSGKPQTVSLAQFLLKQSLMVDRRAKDSIFDVSEELQRKHARIEAMTRPNSPGNPAAQKALVEVFAAQQLYTLLGEEATVYGPHLTVEQWVRQYTSRTEDQRRDETRALHEHPAYLGKAVAKGIPYDLREAVEKKTGPQISAFRSLTDSMLATGSARITLDAKGYATGEFADRSDAVSKQWQSGFTAAREAIYKFLDLSPADNELDTETVRRMFDQHPDFAARIFKMVPDAAVNAVFELKEDGQVYASNWVYNMFTISDAKHAEMHYWRNLLTAELNAKQLIQRHNEEGEDEGLRGIEYNSLKRRMHRIVWALAANDDAGALLQKFIERLDQATDLREFIKYVNTEPGVRGDQAPITAWIDDVSEFDLDKAGGGWSSEITGSELREAIASMQTAAINLSKDLTDEKTTLAMDRITLDAIRRWHDHLAGDNVKVETGDEALYQQFVQRIKEAGQSYLGLGPQAMIYQSIGAVRGFYAQAHTKGKTADNVNIQGAFDAMRDSYDYVTNYERLMASMTAVNLDAVSGNFSLLAKDRLRTMDDDGKQVTWDVPGVEKWLDMLSTPANRGAARAVLFPQVMERDFDGVMRPKMLHGKELKPLLDGSLHKQMFNDRGVLKLDPALRYISMLEAQTREYKGHYPVQRAINDIVIARTSAADHVLSTDELEDLVVKTYHEVARNIQAFASIEANRFNPKTRQLKDPSAPSPLVELMSTTKKAQRMVALGRRLQLRAQDQPLTDVALKQLTQDRKKEALAEKREIRISMPKNITKAQRAEYTRQMDLIDDEVKRFEQQLNLLLDDDVASTVAAMYEYNPSTDELTKVAAQKKLTEYVGKNLTMLESVVASTITLRKLTSQMRDDGLRGNITMSDAEWKEIASAVTAVHLASVAESAGANLTVTPFPDEDHKDDRRYYDSSFSYLVEPLMNPDGPIMMAAKDLHWRSGRHDVVTEEEDVVRLMSQTLFAEFSLGQWTADIPRLSMEANNRLDSAAAEMAIAMAGNSPKRQAIFAAALKRRFTLPHDQAHEDSLITRTTLKSTDLIAGVFDTVKMQLPTGEVDRPLVQLNNRFARSVTARYKDASGVEQTIDLLASDPNLGRPWAGGPEFDGTSYQEIHLTRVRNAVARMAWDMKMRPSQMEVDIEFFHPESQPDDTGRAEGDESWHNSLLFEGTAFELDGDQSDSLVSTQWFQNGSLSPSAQAAALQASKKGKAALQVIPTVPSAKVENLENNWRRQFAEMLNAKTQVMLTTDLGFGRMDAEAWNATYKDLKMRHYVRGKDADGKEVVWTAEQVLNFQAQNPGVDLPLTEAELWIPTDTVLRSLLGEQGTQGVTRLFPDELEIDLARVDGYTGITADMIDRFEGMKGATAELEDTRIGNVARQSTFVVRAKLSKEEKSRYDARISFLNAQREAISGDRAGWSGSTDRLTGGWNPQANLSAVMDAAKSFLHAENIALDFVSGGAPYIGPRKPIDIELSKMLLHQLEAALDKKGNRAGWIYQENSHSEQSAGILNGDVLDPSKQKGAMRVAPGDIVVLQLDTFQGDRDLLEKRLHWFVERGVTLVLGSSDGSNDLRAEAEVFLDQLDYGRVAGSVHVYQENNRDSRFQNVRARTSSLIETRGVSKANRIVTFLLKNKPIAENAAWVNIKSKNLSAIKVQLNLVPTDAWGGFNVPVNEFATDDMVDRTKAHLYGLNNDEGKKLLLEQSNGHIKAGEERDKADAEFLVRWDSLIDRLERNQGTVLPVAGDKFGTGDLIPLVDKGNPPRVILYRHGMKAPKRLGNKRSLEAMMAQTRDGKQEAANVAVYPYKPNPAATTHEGDVVRFHPRSGYGMAVEMNIPLSVFGDKKVLQWNGMKYLLTPMPDSISLPEDGFFDQTGQGVDIIASIDDTVGKEATDGTANNHRNAFAYLGMDFMPDVMKFFNTDENTARKILGKIARDVQPISLEAAHDMLNGGRITKNFLELMTPVAGAFANEVNPNWLNTMNDLSVEAQVVTAMMVYLATPGAQMEHVLRSGGFNDDTSDPDARSRLMPRLFTQVFDNAEFGSPLRVEINKRLNATFDNPKRAQGVGYRLMEDFTFITTAENGEQLEGWLQFAEAHSSGDNPITNGMSFDENASQAVSQHSQDIAYAAIGARTAYPKDIAKARAWAEGEGLTKFTSGQDAVDGGAWRMLTNIDATSGPVWRAPLPAEATYRVNAREEVTKTRQALERSVEHGWTPEVEAEYDKRAIALVESMNLKASQKILVDFWVRQMSGELGGPHEDEANRGWVSGQGALDMIDLIEKNVRDHYVPTAGGMIPMLHVHDLQHIYRANRHQARPWLLRYGQDTEDQSDNWGEWVKIALGTMGKSEDLFDPAFLLATDGLMHTYQNATEQLLDLPVSLDDVAAAKILDPETSRMLVSLDRNTDLLTEDPVVLNVHRASIDDLLGGRRGVEGLKRKYPPRHEMAKRMKRLENWRKQVDSPFPVDQSSKSFLKNGTELIDRGTTTNALMRMLVNLRVGTALINPALWVSMGPEMWVRGSLDRAANMLTGQGTVGFTAKRQAAITDAAATRTQEKQRARRADLEKQLAAATDPDEVAKISRELDKTPRVGWLESLGLTHRYTPDQLDKLGKLYTIMGQRNDFKAMVYRDLMFLRPHEPGISRMEKWLEGYARLGSRMQDPTWGMRGNTMARRYLEAALQSIHATPTLHALTTDQLIAHLSTDPEWIRKNLPDAHLYATNAIAQIRSLKATPASLFLRGIYEPMSDSPNMAWNMLGNLVLKLPMLFSGYAANVATTILGLQGLSDMTAMFLHGRKKWGIIGRAQAKIAGREYDEEGDDAHFDMSEVIEGIDLSRSFIRGGLTHTGLFAFGLMAGGLGLSGEDDETKKRRKMAALQGAGFVYDPRAVENDFRNADAMYFDLLPFGLDELFQSDEGDARSMWQPSWVIKQFISPIMGMEKFFETGDFKHVTWGFQDALGSFPLINSMMWSDAVETASVLASKANHESSKGTTEGLVNGMGFLTTAVGVYERMLVENAFVNSLYVGKDKYDRDPYKLPLRDSDGTIQRDIENEARSQNLSTEQFLMENRDRLTREIAGGKWKGQLYVDPETAEVKQGYISRDGKEATLHTFTESRATLATIAAIGDMLTGGPGFHNSDYFRENMVIKQREFEKPKVSAAEAKAFVLAAFQGRGGQRELSADDISSRIKADFKARGEFVDWDKVDAYAAQAVKQQGPALMSEWKDGKESLTSEGALKVFEGLSKGSVHFGEASLAGLAIPFEMREKIQDQWMKQIIQEGMDMHLSQFQATSRMKRLWYGPTSNSQVVGLGDILWSKDISYDTKLVFNQLNTTYVMGPDGRPWATGWGRADVFNSLGLKPGQTQTRADQGITGTDNRGNTTYLGGGVTGGLNTGLRSLELVDKSRYVPTDVEIGKSIEDAIKNAAKQDFTPFQPFSKSGGGFHFTPFRRFGFGHRGFGGGGFGGGGGGFSDFHPMRSFPTARAPFANEIPFINTSNPLIRRADTRRERVWSERGRLKQWQ